MTTSPPPPAGRPAPDASPSLPPPAALLRLLLGYGLARAVHAVAELGIADALSDGARGVDDLAGAVGADRRALYRLLRALASVGVFTEAEPGRFALTPVGALLRGDTPVSLRAFGLYTAADFIRRAVDGLPQTVRTGASAFEREYGMSFFAYLEQHPGDAALFDEAMTSVSSAVVPAVLAAYDFSDIRTLVDFGRGHGSLLAAVLRAHPTMRGVLFDRPAVVEGARRRFEAEGLADRADLVGGDFFEALPRGADAYLLKSVIHDWDDAQATAILRRCRTAMPGEARVLVIDPIIPPGDQPSPNKLVDLLLLPLLGGGGGRERTEAEYRALFEAAGLRLVRAVPTASPSWLLEGTPGLE
jgi:hypothetical protein